MAQRRTSSRTTETKAPEHQWDDRSSGDSRIEISTLKKDQIASPIASKKETVADDTANNNTSITSRVSRTTRSDFSKNLEEPSLTENEEEIDNQTRSVDSHEIQCEKEYEIDLRVEHCCSRTRTRFRPPITENRSITNILVKERVNTLAKGKATT